MLAGVLHGYLRGEEWDECLRHGLSAATATALSREPGMLDLADVREFYEAADVQITHDVV